MTKHILVVARWPLGGIRTYMRYMFRHLLISCKLTILAASTHEDAALKKDTVEYGADLKLVQASGSGSFVLEVYKALYKKKYDLILSQGFISAVAVYLANIFLKIPHVLTIHGIVEPKYLSGRFRFFKRLLLRRVLSQVTVLYAVSNDMLNHIFDQFPELKQKGLRSIVIPNGIDPGEFKRSSDTLLGLRAKLGIDDATFLFGFFGRFMPQKGFDLLIEAANVLRRREIGWPFAIVAVGSGDYVGEYRSQIAKMGLEDFFYFLPFQPQVQNLYQQVDCMVMPSRWEASGLLAMEALCMGTPLITSDCIGLRETVADTPVKMFMSENVNGLVDCMFSSIRGPQLAVFLRFSPVACERYDVAKSAKMLTQFIGNMPEFQ